MTGESTATDDAGADGEPPVRCGYCGRRFAREEWRALHRGLDHEDRLTEPERAAFREAYESEREDLRLFRLQALLGLVLLYFGFLIVYAVVT
jgi:hypothetical protein